MSHDKGALNERPFVMITPQGLAYVGLHKDEADCWQVALGWPSDDEIAARKAEGYAVYPATLTWQEASNTSPQVPEALPWKGLNLHSMADAFEQVIEAAAYRENPFVNPVTKQAQLALREFKLCIPAMQAIDAARKGE